MTPEFAKRHDKRNPGFAPIRRGLLEHWPAMSVNARAFYVWLHLRAHWSGPKRGCVEASFDDMARGNGWSLKTLQRTLEELEAMPFIEIERASNQYALTRVRILKYDLEESTSALDKSDHSSTVGVDSAQDSGVVKFDCTTDHSNPSISQSQQDLRAPKKVKEVKKEKNGESDAVRRPVDAERRSINHSVLEKNKVLKKEERSEREKCSLPSRRRGKLSGRLEAKIREGGNKFDRELDADERAAFAAMRYSTPNWIVMSDGFVATVWEIYEKHKDQKLPAGILCTKVIDRCMSQQEACKTLGSYFNDPSDYYWPPDFTDHRDRLMKKERLQKRVNAQKGA